MVVLKNKCPKLGQQCTCFLLFCHLVLKKRTSRFSLILGMKSIPLFLIVQRKWVMRNSFLHSSKGTSEVICFLTWSSPLLQKPHKLLDQFFSELITGQSKIFAHLEKTGEEEGTRKRVILIIAQDFFQYFLCSDLP